MVKIMNFCKYCCISMVGVMSFSKDKHERFCRCPRCRSETKHKKIKNDLDFREVLSKTIHKKINY